MDLPEKPSFLIASLALQIVYIYIYIYTPFEITDQESLIK
jgi:hypothetical protein